MPLTSVIIPAYNASRYVAGAIRSVLAQTTQEFEITVVDDGSTDQTFKAVEPFLSDWRVTYVYQDNRGLPGARNSGAKASKGDYLAFLDADDFLAPDALARMLAEFKKSKAAWSITGVLKLEAGKSTVRHVRVPEGDLFLSILKQDFVTRSPFYPRDQFFAIGMYDEEIRMREDWDINIRMIAASKPFVVIDEPLYLYSRTEGSITTGNLRKLYSYTEKLLRKHHRQLAEAGREGVARIYAENMWDLARRYCYELRDLRETTRCAVESLRYDMSVSRLFHPVVHRLETAFAKR